MAIFFFLNIQNISKNLDLSYRNNLVVRKNQLQIEFCRTGLEVKKNVHLKPTEHEMFPARNC